MAELRAIDLLTPHNYHTWKLKMQQLLQSKGLWQMLAEEQPTFSKEMERFAYRNKLDEAMSSLIHDEHASIEDYLTKFRSLVV